MKLKFLYAIIMTTSIFSAGGKAASTIETAPPVLTLNRPAPAPTPAVETTNNEISVLGETVAKLDTGHFDSPVFSPDGRKIAYSKDDARHAEIYLYDLQTRKSTILLSARQSKKYQVDGSMVSTIEWLGANRLRAYLSDGDVGTTTLTFNTLTRRILQGVTTYYDDDTVEVFPKENLAVYNLFLKKFPDVSPEAAKHVFSNSLFYKIRENGLILQFRDADTDSNVWYFDLASGKKELLAEAPAPSETGFELAGVTEVAGSILFLTEQKYQTTFWIYQNGKTTELMKTKYRGSFQPLFKSTKKSVFMLRETDYEQSFKSSLWFFDGKTLRRASDTDEIENADIDKTGTKIVYSYETNERTRHVTVKKLKNIF